MVMSIQLQEPIIMSNPSQKWYDIAPASGIIYDITTHNRCHVLEHMRGLTRLKGKEGSYPFRWDLTFASYVYLGHVRHLGMDSKLISLIWANGGTYYTRGTQKSFWYKIWSRVTIWYTALTDTAWFMTWPSTHCWPDHWSTDSHTCMHRTYHFHVYTSHQFTKKAN